MIQYALHNSEYLDVAQYYHKIWETPSVKDDTNGKGREVSGHSCELGINLNFPRRLWNMWCTTSCSPHMTTNNQTCCIACSSIPSSQSLNSTSMCIPFDFRCHNKSSIYRLLKYSNLVKCFVTRELMRWPGIQEIYGPTLRSTHVFGNDQEKRWEDLHTRVIEHVSALVNYFSACCD